MHEPNSKRMDVRFSDEVMEILRHLSKPDGGQCNDETLSLLQQLVKQGEHMSVEFDRLTQEVSEIRTVSDSAIALLTKLAGLIESMKNDPKAIQKLADELDSKANELGDAITASTPVEVPPGPGPDPTPGPFPDPSPGPSPDPTPGPSPEPLPGPVVRTPEEMASDDARIASGQQPYTDAEILAQRAASSPSFNRLEVERFGKTEAGNDLPFRSR